MGRVPWISQRSNTMNVKAAYCDEFTIYVYVGDEVRVYQMDSALDPEKYDLDNQDSCIELAEAYIAKYGNDTFYTFTDVPQFENYSDRNYFLLFSSQCSGNTHYNLQCIDNQLKHVGKEQYLNCLRMAMAS